MVDFATRARKHSGKHIGIAMQQSFGRYILWKLHQLLLFSAFFSTKSCKRNIRTSKQHCIARVRLVAAKVTKNLLALPVSIKHISGQTKPWACASILLVLLFLYWNLGIDCTRGSTGREDLNWAFGKTDWRNLAEAQIKIENFTLKHFIEFDENSTISLNSKSFGQNWGS